MHAYYSPMRFRCEVSPSASKVRPPPHFKRSDKKSARTTILLPKSFQHPGLKMADRGQTRTSDETSKKSLELRAMKRRLLAESDEEEPSRAPSRGVEKAKSPHGAAQGAAASGAAASGPSVSSLSPFFQLLQKCGLSLSKGASSAHSGASIERFLCANHQVILAQSEWRWRESCVITTLLA